MEWHRVCVVSIEYVPGAAIPIYLLTPGFAQALKVLEFRWLS